jgi:surface polysaccharide O-acyltransferase-like enzyme
VVVVHGVGWGLTAMFAWTHRYLPVAGATPQAVGSASYLVLRVIQQAAVFSVPAFLFVSGVFVLFATPKGRSSPGWGAIRGRLITLTVPYLIWTGVVWVLVLLQGTSFSPREYVQMLLTGSTTPAYYYVPVLIQLYLLTPLIVAWTKAHWVSLLLVTAMVQMGIYTLPYALELGVGALPANELRALVPKWLFVGYVFWFSLGAVVAHNLPAWRDGLRRSRWGLLASAGLSLVLGVWGWESLQAAFGSVSLDHTTNPIDMLYTLAEILAFVGFQGFPNTSFRAAWLPILWDLLGASTGDGSLR